MPNRWPDQRIRAELEDFLHGNDTWPSYRDFVRADRRALRDAITRNGGAVRWARELGVRYVERRPGHGPVWTEERIRHDLEAFLEGRPSWPSRREFEAAGLKPLRDAVTRTGGSPRWAAEMGLGRRDERAGSRRVWTPDRIDPELRRLIELVGGWPTKRQFREAGLLSMLGAIYRFEGVAYWQRLVGLDRPERPQRTPDRLRWSDERLRHELTQFCAGRTTFPTAAEFEAAGLGHLYRAASLHGGIRRWRAELGWPRPG